MNSVELFAGAGGLALGVSQAGFSHEAGKLLFQYRGDFFRSDVCHFFSVLIW